MATIDVTVETKDVGYVEAIWPAMANGDDGEATSKLTRYADKTVQAVGTFGAGGNAQLQGSNDGSNWVALKDFEGSLINITAVNQLYLVAESPKFVRPVITAGDGTTSITFIIVAARRSPS